jgi:hypothetical protein
VALVALAASVGTSYAHFCTNASKPVGAGTKVVLDTQGNVVSFTSPSYRNQIERAGKSVDELRGGFIGTDFDGDGVADVDTYNHPKGVVPAALNGKGQDCKGVTNFEELEAAGCVPRQK